MLILMVSWAINGLAPFYLQLLRARLAEQHHLHNAGTQNWANCEEQLNEKADCRCFSTCFSSLTLLSFDRLLGLREHK